MKCTNHSEENAGGMCVKCGKPYCEACLVEVGGKNECRRCLKNKKEEKAAPTIVVHNTNSNENNTQVTAKASAYTEGSGPWIGAAVACCCCLLLIFGIGGA